MKYAAMENREAVCFSYVVNLQMSSKHQTQKTMWIQKLHKVIFEPKRGLKKKEIWV